MAERERLLSLSPSYISTFGTAQIGSLTFYAMLCMSAGDEPSSAPAVWADVFDADAGKPRAWINFEKPFAELPPIFFPPEPELASTLPSSFRTPLAEALIHC